MTLSQTARKYIGQTEKTGNSGFLNTDFEKKMVAVGFLLHQAWCCYFAELCCKETFVTLVKLFDTVFSGSVMVTHNNIKKLVKEGSTVFEIIEEPEENCLIFYTSYTDGKPSPSWTGHVSIGASKTEHDKYIDISGNTNIAGSREGTTVLDKEHKLSVMKNVNDGLRLTLIVRIKEAA